MVFYFSTKSILMDPRISQKIISIFFVDHCARIFFLTCPSPVSSLHGSSFARIDWSIFRPFRIVFLLFYFTKAYFVMITQTSENLTCFVVLDDQKFTFTFRLI